MFKEILGDAFPLIEKFAPVIGNALGSPLGGAAVGYLINILANKFGIDASDIKNLAPAILGDEEAEDKLADLEYTFGDWVKNSSRNFQLKLPQKAEITIKVEWAA